MRKKAETVLASSSALPRVMVCPDSELIGPRVLEEATQYTTRGTTAHGFLKDIGDGIDPAEALAKIPADDPGRELCEALPLDSLPRGGKLEIALAWDFETSKGRVLGHDIGREYEKHGADRSREFVGSFDFAGKHVLGHGVLVDYKTGWGALKASESWQLRSGAVFLADTFGLEEVEAAHMYIRDGQDPRWDFVRFDSLDLAAARADLKSLAKRLLSGKRSGVLVEGAHCKYCPVYNSCPAKVGLTRSLVKLRPQQSLTLDKARDAVLTLEKYEEVAKRVWSELEAFAEETPIDLGDGRWLRMAPGRESEVVTAPAVALAVVAELCGEEAAKAAMSTTKAAIADAVRVWALGGGRPIGPAQKEVIGRVRDARAIETKAASERVRIVKADRK